MATGACVICAGLGAGLERSVLGQMVAEGALCRKAAAPSCPKPVALLEGENRGAC